MIAFVSWNIDPIIIDSLPLFRWYGLFWAVGMLLSYKLGLWIYKRQNQSEESLDKLLAYLIPGIIIGARIGHVLFYEPVYYLNHPIEVLPIKLEPHFQFTGLAGLASHGGVIGALIAIYLYNRHHKIDYLRLLDRLIVPGALLGGFIRLGNLMNSEIIGIPSQLPWAFIFERVDQIPRHPAQLYEAMFYFIVAMVLFWMIPKTQNFKGQLFGIGLLLIFVMRFFIEFVKEDQVAFEAGMILNMGQVLSSIPIMAGLTIIIMSVKRPNDKLRIRSATKK